MSRSFVRRIVNRSAHTIAVAACIAGLFLAGGTVHAQGLYQSPSPNLNTGTTPKGVAAADFALSGYQSLVVTDSASSNMKVYLANGPGSFNSGYTYSTCSGPTTVLAGDANKDGYPDIAVACPSSNTIDIFLNNGASSPGTFALYTTLTVTDPVAMVSGDFTGNGNVDLAVISGSGGVTTFLNVGDGTSTTKTSPQTGTLTGIVTADFNHDGHLDLAISDSANNDVHVLKGDGTGAFSSLGNYSTGTGTKPAGIVTADFNHDGNADVATINAGKSTATVLLGSATGALTLQTAQSTGTGPIGIAVADVNSDGYPDVIAFDSPTTSTGAVAVLLGNGNGTLQTVQLSSQTFVPGTVAAVADFNRDGKPDLAVTQQNTNMASLLLNNTLPTPYPGGRSFTAGSAIAAGNGNMADSIATLDFNQDGKLDVAVSYLEDNAVRVLQGNGSGGFTLSGTYAVGQQPYTVISADVNGDGYPDIITANTSLNSATGTVSVLLNNRNGTFATAASYTVGRLPYQVAVGDVNGDGYPDLAVSNYGANTVSILYGSKTGTFTAGPTLTTGTNPYGVVIGDFQHDGFPDVAVTCYGIDMLYIFPNNGNGTFGTPYMYSTGSGPMSLVKGDFNRDGKLDLVVANATGGPAGDTDPTTSGNNVSFFAGNGDGTFQNGVISPSLNFPDSIAAADINGDGILDIVGVAPNFNAIEVTLGAGDGTFGTIQQRAQGEFTAAKQPWALAVGNFHTAVGSSNNHGQIDIVTANTYNQVNIAIPAYQTRYMTQYPPVTGGNPSVDLLTNLSAATISLSTSPASPIPANNTGTTISATVNPVSSGPTPTGSVIFENSTNTPVGTGPYALADGVATYNVGHLGSGQYLFTTLYSGDTSFQPTTISGNNAAITVAGTPVTLSLSSASVDYGSTFTASVTVVGNAATGGYPRGTATIYEVSGGTAISLGTTNALQQVGFGNTSSSTITITATAPNLDPGTYQLYAVYNPNGGNYAQGSSSTVPLTVIAVIPTSTSISCTGGLFGGTCTATVTVTTTGAPVPVGSTVNFSGVGTGTETTNASGQATYGFSEVFGSFTVTATFPAQNGYGTSSNSTGVICFILCGLDRGTSTPFNSLTGLGFGNFATPAASKSRNVPFFLF